MADPISPVDAAIHALNAAVIQASLHGARVHIGVYLLHIPSAPFAVPLAQASVEPPRATPRRRAGL